MSFSFENSSFTELGARDLCLKPIVGLEKIQSFSAFVFVFSCILILVDL